MQKHGSLPPLMASDDTPIKLYLTYMYYHDKSNKISKRMV